MKNVFQSLLMVASLAAMVSCSSDSSGPEATFDQLVIAEIDFPDSFSMGRLYNIPVTYQLPDGCTEFHSLDVGSPSLTEREIVAIGIRTDAGGCTQAIRVGTENLVFQVLNDQTYLFRYWQGNDANGEPIFVEVEVPVE